jgi:hypothetical protein
MVYIEPQNSYKLSNRTTIRNLESILKILDDVKPVLIGEIAIAAYARYYSLPYDRKFRDIELVISKNKEKYTKEIICNLLINKNKWINTKEIEYIIGSLFVDGSIKIIYKDGPNINILFEGKEIPYNEMVLEFGKKIMKLYVAKIEYLYEDRMINFNEYDIKLLDHLKEKIKF